MVSLGEESIQLLGGQQIGHCRVRSISPDSGLYPRLRIHLGMLLNVVPPSEPGSFGPPRTPLSSYRLEALTGELRFRDNGPALGVLHWVEKQHRVRAWSHPSEHHLIMICELDRTRLEKLEELRDGGPLQFGLVLYPTFVQPWNTAEDERRDPLEVEIRPFTFTVYQEQWTNYLRAVGFGTTDIIEIRYDLEVAESFQRAVEHTRAARAQILAGNYNQAVALTRKVWETLEKAPFSKGAIQEALTRGTSPLRVEPYDGIVSRLKKLANLEVHDQAVPPSYSRREALFVVGTTEHLIGLIAEGSGSRAT